MRGAPPVFNHNVWMPRWIDTHCHLDAPEFAADVDAVRAAAREAGVRLCVLPAVRVADFDAVCTLAHRHGDAYALGIHPLCVAQASDTDLDVLERALSQHRDDPHLVAVGEIGLDFFVSELQQGVLHDKQQRFYRAQLAMARRHGLPVLLHVRRSVDAVLQGLRSEPGLGGIAHAFNGSVQQAHQALDLGLGLGFGGAMTYERAAQLRRLARDLPLSALVLETDAPDMPPHWLYRTAQARAAGAAQGRNSPAELPRIGEAIAKWRGIAAGELAHATWANSLRACPRLASLPLDVGHA